MKENEKVIPASIRAVQLSNMP